MRLFLPVRPISTIRCGRSTSTNVTSAQLKRLRGRLHAKAGAGAAADRVDPREVPVDQEVVGELGVVGDVLQVVEDLLARGGDDDRDGHRVHGARQSSPRGGAARRGAALGRAGRAGAPSWPCSAWRTASLATRRLARSVAAQLADESAVRGRSYRWTLLARSAACARSRRSGRGRPRARRRRGAAAGARASRCRQWRWPSLRHSPPRPHAPPPRLPARFVRARVADGYDGCARRQPAAGASSQWLRTQHDSGPETCYDRHELPSGEGAPGHSSANEKGADMESIRSGTFVGLAPSVASAADTSLTLERLENADRVPVLRRPRTSCAPRCSAPSASPADLGADVHGGDARRAAPARARARLAEAREQLEQPGEYLVYEDGRRAAGRRR